MKPEPNNTFMISASDSLKRQVVFEKADSKTFMLGIIEDCSLEVEKKVFHLKVKLDGDELFFIVCTLQVPNHKGIVTSIKRGNTFWDTRRELKKSEKEKVKKFIEEYVEKKINNEVET